MPSVIKLPEPIDSAALREAQEAAEAARRLDPPFPYTMPETPWEWLGLDPGNPHPVPLTADGLQV